MIKKLIGNDVFTKDSFSKSIERYTKRVLGNIRKTNTRKKRHGLTKVSV